MCTPDSQKINEISGLVATADRLCRRSTTARRPAASPGSSRSTPAARSSARRSTTSRRPRDPEDLALDKNGTLWIADIGDNTEAAGGTAAPRPTIAVWNLPQGAKAPVINRLAYPDGKKRDAEAMLLNGDGTPIIITKDPVGEVWIPEGPLQPNTTKGVKLKQIGTFTPAGDEDRQPARLPRLEGDHRRRLLPDGTRVVIRTYSDAYEFDVQGGDVIKAITTGKPRITPLPNEAQRRGDHLLDRRQAVRHRLRRARRREGADPQVHAAERHPGQGRRRGPPTPKPADRSFLEDLTLQDITYMVAAVGVLGLILVVAGIIGIRRSRAGRRAAAGTGPGPRRRRPAPPDDDLPPAPEEGGTGNVYGGARLGRSAARGARGRRHGLRRWAAARSRDFDRQPGYAPPSYDQPRGFQQGGYPPPSAPVRRAGCMAGRRPGRL